MHQRNFMNVPGVTNTLRLNATLICETFLVTGSRRVVLKKISVFLNMVLHSVGMPKDFSDVKK